MRRSVGDDVLLHIGALLFRLGERRCQWGVEFTDEWREVPAVITIFAADETERLFLRKLLGYNHPVDETDTTETHMYSRVLTVVIAER